MRPLAHINVLWLVLAWRGFIVVSSLILGAAVSGLIGRSDALAGYLVSDVLLTLAFGPLVAHLGSRARSLHMALAAGWLCGAFFLVQLL